MTNSAKRINSSWMWTPPTPPRGKELPVSYRWRTLGEGEKNFGQEPPEMVTLKTSSDTKRQRIGALSALSSA